MPTDGTASATSRPPPASTKHHADALLPFNLDDLRSRGLFSPLINWLLENPLWWLALLRRFWPIPSVRNWALVTRFDDVQEVLRQHQIFQVPWVEKVRVLNGGPNFLLGIEEREEHRRMQKQVMEVFRFDDIATIVGPWAAQFSAQIVANSPGRLDAIQDLITRVPTLLCEHYYGVKVAPNNTKQELVDFANWTIAMSTYTFGDPGDDYRYRRAALAGSQRVRALIDRSIAEAKGATGRDDVLARLVELQKRGATGLTDDVIRAYLIGMITGFIPTNTMAAGQTLEVLLRRPDFLARAQAAAVAGDDDLLKRCVFEAGRFKHINLGPFRRCEKDYMIAQGTSHKKRIRKGMKLLASTQSAMFDGRRVKDPYVFNPDRPASDYMLFGYGLHWCVGAFIAEAQITQTFKALLVKPGLRPADEKDGRLQRLGQFPAHLWVEFDR